MADKQNVKEFDEQVAIAKAKISGANMANSLRSSVWSLSYWPVVGMHTAILFKNPKK